MTNTSRPMNRRTFLSAAGATAVAIGTTSTLAGAAHAANVPLASTNGFTSHDVDPRTSTLGNVGAPTRLALDYASRSVGADLGSVKGCSAIEIVQETAKNRLNQRDLAVYVSNDNKVWQRIDSDLVMVGSSQWLRFARRSTRFVKVHCYRRRTDETYTCVLADLQTSLRVHDLGAHMFVGGNGGTWRFRTPVTVKNTTSSEQRDRPTFVFFKDLGTADLIAAGKLEADLRDIRVASADGQELHAYANSGGMHIRIPRLAAGDSTTVYVYSGNPSAGKRIGRDVGALQVEYGHSVIAETADSNDGVKVVELPSGQLVALVGAGSSASATPNGRIDAQFSSNGGRSWGPVETFKPASTPEGFAELPQAAVWDPERKVFSLFFGVIVKTTEGGDFTDPAQNHLETWIAQAKTFDGNGRPVWEKARKVAIQNRTSKAEAAWTISYTTPIITSRGAYLHIISYIKRADGTFVSVVVRSTDGGLTWVQSADELELPAQIGFETGITEPAMAELVPGTIEVLARQQLGEKFHLAQSRSTDDGVTWAPVTDSTVLASNTQPAFFKNRATTSPWMLSIPGHNAFSQTSYYRNDLTVCHTDDGGRSWKGYHDLLQGTELSAPGWAGTQDQRRMQNADSAPSGTSDRVFAWANPGGDPGSMLVEDIDRYVRDSHGALDVLGERNAHGVANGTELADWCWWRTTRDGTLDVVGGSRAGRRAVRLRSGAAKLAAASRLFPAVRDGRITFALKLPAAGGGLSLCLQEGYSRTPNARGTALLLRVAPDGKVTATTSDTFVTTADIGHENKDVDPSADGRLHAVGQYGAVGFDYQNRSIGADLYRERAVTSLELIDDDVTSSAGNRVDPTNLEVWRSVDNEAWTRVTGWSGEKTGSRIVLTGPQFTSRFVKVAHPYSDTAWTFGNDRQSILRVLPDVETPPVFSPLSSATTLSKTSWHQFALDVNLAADKIVVIVDGAERASLPALHAAEVVGHLLVSFDAASTSGGEVLLDDFIVRDRVAGLPTVTGVGTTVPL